MWNDNETSSDLIDFQHMVSAITSIINNDDLLPCSIGIFGDWGSGKSSLMKMVAEKYSDKNDILVINFNGWLFEGYEDTKTVLMGRIVDEIIKKRTIGEKALKIAANLLRKIDLIKLGGQVIKHGLAYLSMGPAGLAITSSNEVLSNLSNVDYEKYIKDHKGKSDPDEELKANIQDFHLNFEQLINETKIEKIIVLIDDLDRCSHDTVIGTLEAIKLFLFVKKTAFIIGADERLIKYAVRRRFPEIPGDNTEVGRDYLEKLIQFPIRIPPLSDLELTIYVNFLFTFLYTDPGEFEEARKKVLKKKNEDQFGFTLNLENIGDFINDADERLKEALLLSAQITPVLAVGLNGNPRQTKRFLNTILVRYAMAKSKGEELNKRILAKLMLLEYFKSETFKTYYLQQANNKGYIPAIEVLETLAKADDNDDKKVKKMTGEQQALLQDSWIKNWLKSEPSLVNVDLQPYFYYSRDKLSASGINLRRMSSQAQEVFRKLISESETIKNSALQDSKSINSGDASSIFESLTEKITREGKQTGDSSTLKRLFDFSKTQIDLISQFLVFIDKLPHQILPLSAVTWVLDITEDTNYREIALKIINDWSKSTTNRKLATIASKKLETFS